MNNGQDILLSIDRARVQFGELVAVRDVSLKLHGGDLVGLIGPNGAGKTTFLRAVAGLQSMTRGTMEVLGMPAGPGQREALRYIGFTPDTPPVYEEMTARQFLRFIAMGYDLGMGQVDERIDFWLEKVWLAEKADQKIKGLSRGMRQRIGIVRTLLPNPMVILLDEPAAGLDPAGRVQFRQLLCDLREQGKALIVSSHFLADMDEYCTHIAIMAHGALLQFGTVAEVAGAASGVTCRYTILLARPMAGLGDLLGKIAGVEDVQVDRERVTLEFYSDREEAAGLLAKLIEQKVPVASFSANAIGLEEAYLRTGIKQVD